MKLRWTAPALRDLEAIGDAIARDSPAAAGRVVARILDQAEALTTHPHIGRPGRVPETRELVITDTPYIAPYRVRGEDVQILAALHGARRSFAWKARAPQEPRGVPRRREDRELNVAEERMQTFLDKGNSVPFRR